MFSGWIFKHYAKIKSALIIILVICSSYLVYVAASDQTAPSPQLSFINGRPVLSLSGTKAMIDIAGAVQNPGVYEITPGITRIVDVVKSAGGFHAQVDISAVAKQINLAKIVGDQEKIYFPFQQEIATQANLQDSKASSSGKVNINTASAAELESIPGVGPGLAANIIDARPFEKVEELQEVSGIGEKKYEDILPLVDI